MKFLTLATLVVLLSLAVCYPRTRRNPDETPEIQGDSDATDDFEEGFDDLYDLGCGFHEEVNSLVINDLNFNNYTDAYNLNLSAIMINNRNKNQFSVNVLLTGIVSLDDDGDVDDISIDTINFRGDLINSYGFSFPNADNELVTNFTDSGDFFAENNITLTFGWPFNCAAWAEFVDNNQLNLVNYVNNDQHVGNDENEYVALAKIQIIDDDYDVSCHNLLFLEDNWTISLAAIRFFVDCDENEAPYI